MTLLQNAVKSAVVLSFLILLGGSATAGEAPTSPGAFRKADTTPPTVSIPLPAPDSTTGQDVTISARFADAGSGIDLASLRVLLDGRDVTRQAEVRESGVLLRPAKPLEEGIHRAEISVSDKAGDRGNRMAWRFGVNVPVPVEAGFDRGLFLVNGEPFFPIGIYNVDTRPWRSEKLLAQSAEAGINCQLVDEASARRDFLDLMLKHRQKAIMLVHYGDTIKPTLAGDRTRMDQVLLAIKEHPALLGWWSEYPASTPEGIQSVTPIYDLLKKEDPHHPMVWICCWAAALRWCANSDVYFTALYPILDAGHPEYTVASLGSVVLEPAFAAAAAEGKGKQVWLLSQAYDPRFWKREGQPITTPPSGFRPNPAELRAMNYFALTEGVKGLFFYATGTYDPETKEYNTLVRYPEPWNETLKIAGELRYLSPVLAAGSPVQATRLEPANPAIHCIELTHEETRTLIAVNATEAPASARWVFAAPSQPIVLFEDRALAAKAGEMTDTFKPLEVHIYQWRP